ncbi:MAG: hypothetical protein HOP29_08655, partial [Phycisphaerales bacterium]|nr:hypothetical protein [Phycisphaerales bacterium]
MTGPRRVAPVLASVLIVAWAGRGFAQAPPEPPREDINDLLDRVVVDLRIAEKRGPESQEAFGRADVLLQRAMARDRFHPRARYYEARLLILSNHSQQALRPLQDWIQSPQGENDWEAHYLLGAMYAGGEFYKLAKPVLEKALTMNPTEPAILVELAKCEFKLSDHPAAERRLREAIRLHKDGAEAVVYRLLAEILIAAAKTADAEEPAKLAFEKASNDARTRQITPALIQELDATVTLLQRVKIARVNEGDKSPRLYQDIAALSIHRGQLAQLTYVYQAMSWIRRGMDAAGDTPPEGLLVDAVRILRSLNQTNDAGRLCERLRELYPNNAESAELCANLPTTSDDPPINP